MKAVLCKAYGPPESLVIEDIEPLKPGRGQVVKNALLSCYRQTRNGSMVADT